MLEMYTGILISETDKIDWIDFDRSENEEFFDVDYIFDTHAHFLNALEVCCVAECCGLMAFSFFAKDIAHAVKEVDVLLLKRDLLKLQEDVLNSQLRLISSSHLNNSMHKTVFIKLLEHILLSIHK
jgi:hypothetical protein